MSGLYRRSLSASLEASVDASRIVTVRITLLTSTGHRVFHDAMHLFESQKKTPTIVYYLLT